MADYQREMYLNDKLKTEIENELMRFNESVLDHTMKHAGAGSYFSQFHNHLARIDRYNIRSIIQNTEYPGLTFITRPELNLNSINLRMTRLFSMLDTLDPNTIQFMIRFLLDSKTARNVRYQELISNCPYMDNDSPFLTPITNAVESISGFPNGTLETWTSEAGLFSEDMTIPIGSDRNTKSFDLSMTFSDLPGGICAAILQYWAMYIDRVVRGEMVQHSQDIDQNVMGFTCTIYRFMLDTSKQYITRWCAATGCFPTLRSSGSVFDYSQSDTYVEAARKFNVTFKCNIMGEENDPVILKEFNMKMAKFCPDILSQNRVKLGNAPGDNFLGLPYIVTTANGPKLEFYAKPHEQKDTYLQDSVDTDTRIRAKRKFYEKLINETRQTSSPSGDIVYV